MTQGAISRQVVADRLGLVEQLVQHVRTLPLADQQTFLSDWRNVGAAESAIRRMLEALFDVGRHVLAKGYGQGVGEYKEIAARLHEVGVLTEHDSRNLRLMAGYRNRLVHVYHEVTGAELYELSVHFLGDVEHIVQAYRDWLDSHPDMLATVM